MLWRPALALLTGALATACWTKSAPPPAAPPSKGSLEEAASTEPEPGAADAAAALPFRMPCGDDDLATCLSGCDDRQTEDCVTLGSMYFTGHVVPVDRARGVELFRAACVEGSARGCIRLADACRAGAVPGDDGAVGYYRQACEAGANLGCVAAANAYLAGEGVGADPVFAANLFSRACVRGNAPACYALGHLYEQGRGVKRDDGRAAELFQKACKLGLDEGCLLARRSGSIEPPRQ